jgi:Bacteriophage tail sheath protein
MPTYLTPGVYIEEISTGPRPIEAVGTSVAGFVGVAPDTAKHVNEPMWFDNWTQFTREFVSPGNASTPLAHAVFGFFQNGGGRCCVVNVGADNSIVGDGQGRKGLEVLEESDEIAIVAAPGYMDAESYDALLSHCEKMKDRVAILDAPPLVSKIDALTKVATAAAKTKKSRSASEEAKPSGEAKSEADALRPRQSDGGWGAFYFPHITVRDPLSPKDLVDVPPSGHIAGIYARSDATRGVHKAPANEAVRGALNVTYRVTREEQATLNPSGVNCIRLFPGEGIRVYGARTLAESSSEWRYLNVRRLFNMVEESIARSTRWVVFEPNDRPLWKAIRRDVSAFLTMIWRQGALMGRTPEEAFFVQCDEETNPPDVIDAGMVVTVVGIAPVKPAEFVIFRIGQSAGGTQITT